MHVHGEKRISSGGGLTRTVSSNEGTTEIVNKLAQFYHTLKYLADVIVEEEKRLLKEKSMGRSLVGFRMKLQRPFDAYIDCEREWNKLVCTVRASLVDPELLMFTAKIILDNKLHTYFDARELYEGYLYKYFPIYATMSPSSSVSLNKENFAYHACVNVCISAWFSKHKCILFTGPRGELHKAVLNLGDKVVVIEMKHGLILIDVCRQGSVSVNDKLPGPPHVKCVAMIERVLSTDVREAWKKVVDYEKITDPINVILLYIALQSLATGKPRKPCIVMTEKILEDCSLKCNKT